ncbi:Uncharacterised protein [Escherichia coli]|nr:Uncharacterised protein [Escherichia coli]
MDKKCYGIAKCDAVQIINVDFSAVIIDTFVTRFCHGFGPALLQNAFNKRGYRLD